MYPAGVPRRVGYLPRAYREAYTGWYIPGHTGRHTQGGIHRVVYSLVHTHREVYSLVHTHREAYPHIGEAYPHIGERGLTYKEASQPPKEEEGNLCAKRPSPSLRNEGELVRKEASASLRIERETSAQRGPPPP